MSGVDLGWFRGCCCSPPPPFRPIPAPVCRPWPRASEDGRGWARRFGWGEAGPGNHGFRDVLYFEPPLLACSGVPRAH